LIFRSNVIEKNGDHDGNKCVMIGSRNQLMVAALDQLVPYKRGTTGGSMAQHYHFCSHSPPTFPHSIKVDSSFDLKVVARGARLNQ
jgi:hypothetical protein